MSKEVKRKKKPSFSRQDSHKKKRLGSKWRRPKGLQSKMRLQKKGYKRIVEVGFGTRKDEKGKINDLEVVLVFNKKDLENIDIKKQGIIISSNVGTRNKIEIIKEAEDKKINILNVKNPKDYIKNIEDKRAKIKKEKEEKQKAKEERKKAKPKKEKKGTEKKEEKEMTEEEQKEKEKKEKDKLLTKKE